MRKLLYSLILLVFLAVPSSAMSPAFLNGVVGGGCSGHNCGLDTDSDLYARWLFENDATDSASTNDLSTGAGTPTYVTTSPTPKEGTYSLDLDSGDWLNITDTNLSSGFPFKSGDSQKIITVCAWVNIDSSPGSGAGFGLFTKWNSTVGKRSFLSSIYNDSGTVKWRLDIGYNSGASYDTYYHGATGPSINTWYFVAYSVDASNIYIKLRDSSGNIIGTDYSTALLNAPTINDAEVEIGDFNGGSTWPFIGQMDEMLVFDRVLSAADVTALAKGTY